LHEKIETCGSTLVFGVYLRGTLQN